MWIRGCRKPLLGTGTNHTKPTPTHARTPPSLWSRGLTFSPQAHSTLRGPQRHAHAHTQESALTDRLRSPSSVPTAHAHGSPGPAELTGSLPQHTPPAGQSEITRQAHSQGRPDHRRARLRLRNGCEAALLRRGLRRGGAGEASDSTAASVQQLHRPLPSITSRLAGRSAGRKECSGQLHASATETRWAGVSRSRWISEFE